MKRLLVGALGIAVAVGCTDVFAPLAPGPFLSGEATPLMFTASVSKNPVKVGDTASLIFTLRNPTTKRVTLTFPSTCQITARVRRGRHEVWPNPYSCATEVTRIILDAGTQRTVVLPFTAVSGEDLTVYNKLSLSPASYVAYAELENDEGRSTSVDFTIVR